MSHFPHTNEPLYSTSAPNGTITLYSGPVTITIASCTRDVDGQILLTWLPTPRLQVAFEVPDLEIALQTANTPSGATLQVPALGLAARVDAVSYGYSIPFEPSTARAIFSPQSIAMGTAARLQYVDFHVTNLARLVGEPIRSEAKGRNIWRVTMQSPNWRVTLDSIPNLEELHESLELTGGYAFTHVGRVERSDGSFFSVQEASDVLDALFNFLSFAAGSWKAVLLPCGFDASGARVWQRWNTTKITDWRFVETWLDEFHPDGLTDMFAGFLEWWNNPVWATSAIRLVHLYITANTTRDIDTSIILSQSALELAAWTHFVLDTKEYAAEDFDSHYSDWRLRKLLSNWMSLPNEVPRQLAALRSYARSQSGADGPKAFALVRNALVHPKEPQSVPEVPIRLDARRFGLWYLELTLLRLFNYRGSYSNRLNANRVTGEVETVPWAAS